jgi:hypothetical protein
VVSGSEFGIGPFMATLYPKALVIVTGRDGRKL